jgi:riboflavin kinase/FMN adenylyltransferase
VEVYTDGKLRLSCSVLAIGALDGVHRGHQALIKHAKNHANRVGVPLVVYTFDPPPNVYFKNTMLLTPLTEKVERLQLLGVDYVIVAPFDKSYINREVNAFLNEISDLNPLEIYEGPDFRFGKDREGDIETLRQKFSVNVIEPICCSTGKIISSSRIRNLITQGRLLQAEQLLGWAFLGKGIKTI